MKQNNWLRINDCTETFRWWITISIVGTAEVVYNAYVVMNLMKYAEENTISTVAWVFVCMLCLLTLICAFVWVQATIDFVRAVRHSKIYKCYTSIHSLPVDEQNVTQCYTCKHKSICYGARDVTRR